jgi:tetratricopeptide (TPR) repeat protein
MNGQTRNLQHRRPGRPMTLTAGIACVTALAMVLPGGSAEAEPLAPRQAGQDTVRVVDLSIQNQFNRLWSTGMQYFELQEYANAIPALRRCSELDSTNLDVWYFLGTCYYQIEDLEASIDAFETIVRQDPEQETAIRNLANIYWELEEVEAHTELYERLVELRPENPEYRQHLMALYQNAGNRAGVQRLLEEQAEVDPDNAEVRRRLAAFYRADGDVEAQVAALEAALALDPVNLSNLEQLARIYALELNRPVDATRLYGRIVELQPENPIAWQVWGRYLNATGKPDSAVVALERSLELDPSQGGTYSELALVLSDQQQYDDALAWIEKALDESPGDAYAYVTWGDILQAQAFDQADEDGIVPYDAKIILEAAIEKYRKAIELGGIPAAIIQHATAEAEKLEPFRRTQAEIFMENARRRIPPRS